MACVCVGVPYAAAHKPDAGQKAAAGVDADGVGVASPEQLSGMSLNDTIR